MQHQYFAECGISKKSVFCGIKIAEDVFVVELTSVKLVGNWILDIQTFGWKANGTIIQISDALILRFIRRFCYYSMEKCPNSSKRTPNKTQNKLLVSVQSNVRMSEYQTDV